MILNKFLYNDSNYIYGNNIYKDAFVFSIRYTKNHLKWESGRIVEVDEFEFKHNLPIEKGPGGSPIILLNQNSNEIPVIGIHLETDQRGLCGFGTFFWGNYREKNKSEICLVIFISTELFLISLNLEILKIILKIMKKNFMFNFLI